MTPSEYIATNPTAADAAQNFLLFSKELRGGGGIFKEIYDLLDKDALDTALVVGKAEFLALIPPAPEEI